MARLLGAPSRTIMDLILKKVIGDMPYKLAEFSYYSLEKESFEKFFNPLRTIYRSNITLFNLKGMSNLARMGNLETLINYGLMENDTQWISSSNPAFIVPETMVRPVFNDCIDELNRLGFFGDIKLINYLNSKDILNGIGDRLTSQYLSKMSEEFYV